MLQIAGRVFTWKTNAGQGFLEKVISFYIYPYKSEDAYSLLHVFESALRKSLQGT